MVADGHLTPPPPLPGWNAGASFLTKKETPMPLKLYASDDVITKLENLGDGLGGPSNLRRAVTCDLETGDVRICGIPVEYDPRLDDLDSETPASDTSFTDGCIFFCEVLEGRKKTLRALLDHPDLTELFILSDQNLLTSRRHEIDANIILAYRALEDARMRIGEALQAYDSGTACYIEDPAKETP